MTQRCPKNQKPQTLQNKTKITTENDMKRV